jgi:hypothetical protein
MTVEQFDGGIMVTGEDDIEMFSLLSIKGRLKLEMKGLKFKGRPTFAIIKERYGWKGGKAKVYKLFCEMLDEKQLARLGVPKDNFSVENAMWMITYDHMSEEEFFHKSDNFHETIWKYLPKHKFQIKDCDGNVVWSGVSSCSSSFLPLDEWGSGSGCTDIWYENSKGVYKCL